MATIRKRPLVNGGYRYTATVRTRDGSESKTFSSRKAAADWAKEKEVDLGRGHDVIGQSKATVREAFEAYRKSKTLARDREQMIDWWIERLGGERKLQGVTRRELFKIRDELKEAGLAASTVNHHVSTLHSAFAVGVARGWVARNVASDAGQTHQAARLRLKEPKGRIRFLTDEERKRLLEACQASNEPVLYPLVLAALSTGCRASELLHLEWSDVDLKRGLASIRDSKNGESRAVPLLGPIVGVLERMKEAKLEGMTPDYVFISRTGVGGGSFNYRRPWGDARKAAKIQNFRFHDLRHTTASYLAQANASLFSIGRVLGHKTPAMTQRYAHLVDESITAAGALLAARLSGEKQEEGNDGDEG